MEGQIWFALGLLHAVCALATAGSACSGPAINGTRSDFSVRVTDGDGLVLQCIAAYPVKWIRLYQQDTYSITYQLSQLANDTNVYSEQQDTSRNFSEILRVSQVVENPLAITLFACISQPNMSVIERYPDDISASVLDDLMVTKVHVSVKKASKPSESLVDTLPSTLGDCFPLVHKKSLTAEALLQTLNGDLLASKSATVTLEKWCGDHKLAPVPKVVAKQIPVGQTPPPLPALAAALLRLHPNETDSVRYRSVQLSCGDKVLSVADNWYVSDRLTPEMNEELNHTDIPFGKVVAPFQIFRQTATVQFLWRPLPIGWEMKCEGSSSSQTLSVPDRILEHQAIVCKKDGLPISFVDERYTKSMFDFL